MENLIAVAIGVLGVVMGLLGTFAISLYFGRQTDKLIASCSDKSSDDARRVESLIVSEAQNTAYRVESLILSEAQNTRALLERLGQK